MITNPLDPGGGEEYQPRHLPALRRRPVRADAGRGRQLPRPAAPSPASTRAGCRGRSRSPPRLAPSELRPWPIPLRAPLTAIDGAPGAPAGLARLRRSRGGCDGAVARYTPGQGWQREFLTTSSGAVNKATLRGVAWPEPTHAYAVGDLGAMWEWNADDGLWVADPGVPIGFQGNLLGIAFDPSNPSRGYAVGKGGVLLGYGKSWEQEALPAGFEEANLTSIAFAGSEAIVAAGRDLLVNDGGGWHVDASAHALLAGVRSGNPQLYAVAGLPDGGAVAAGRDIAIERDSAGSPWRFSEQPILGLNRDRRGCDSRWRERPRGRFGRPPARLPAGRRPASSGPERAAADPAAIRPPRRRLPAAGDRRRLGGRAAHGVRRHRVRPTDQDRSRPWRCCSNPRAKAGPSAAGAATPTPRGGALGGRQRGQRGPRPRAHRRDLALRAGGVSGSERRDATASVDAGRAGSLRGCGQRPVRGTVRGPGARVARPRPHSQRGAQPCGEGAGGWGPRALLYTGNRVATGLDTADGERYASLLGSQPGLPVFPALGADDVGDGTGSSVFEASFAGFPAPLGSGAPPAGISTAGIPGAAPGPGARTHYAFDSSGPGGTVRVVVIDNSRGSLAAGDPYQNPAEAQLSWLEAVLADARVKEIPTAVMGNRSLNTSFTPKLNVAGDGDEVAKALVDGGASAYLFDRPEENRAVRIPAGGAATIPSFGTGTLGYRSQLSGVVGSDSADSLFGDAGVMVLELNAAERDPGDEPGARGDAPDPGDPGPLAGSNRRHPAASLDPGPLQWPRPASPGGRSLGHRLGVGNTRSGRRRPLHRVPSRTVPGRGLLDQDVARIQLHLVGPRHRRLRAPGPELDQPAQALP